MMMHYFRFVHIYVLVSFALLGVSNAAGELRSWKDIEGRIIEAEYISHLNDVVRLRMDGRIYPVSLSTLCLEDQEFLKAMSQDVDTESEKRERETKPNKGVLQDPKADISQKEEDQDLDMVEVRLEQRSSSRLQVTIVFDQPMVKHSEIDKMYRLWMELDLDGDSDTGHTNHNDLGNDLSITIFGLDTSSDWETYDVPKSEIGKESKIEIAGIRADERELSFMMKGRDIFEDPNARIRIVSLRGGRVVDTFPDRREHPRGLLLQSAIH